MARAELVGRSAFRRGHGCDAHGSGAEFRQRSGGSGTITRNGKRVRYRGDQAFEPGTGWLYSEGGPNWLADILTTKYRTDLNPILRTRFLGPMGGPTSQLVWRPNRYRPRTLLVDGGDVQRREFGSGISTSIDVMAEFGLMLLRGGRWDYGRLLDASYVRKATNHQAWLAGADCLDADKCPGFPPTTHHGLLFWTNAYGNVANTPSNAYWAAGLGTSFILVIPSLHILVARVGPAWGSRDAQENAMRMFFVWVAAAAS
jgi:CubicO group peptidase (beta-lactamase class C family)